MTAALVTQETTPEERREVDRWYKSLREWKTTPVYAHIPKPPALLPPSYAAYTPPRHLKLAHHPDREKIEETLRAAYGQDFSYRAYAKVLKVSERDLLAFQRFLVDSLPSVRTMGEWAGGERKLLGHWLRLPCGLVDAARVEALTRLAPWEVQTMLLWIRRAPRWPAPGALPESLLRPSGHLRSPIEKTQALYVAVEWLIGELA